MATSVRDASTLSFLQQLLQETAIENQPTCHVPTVTGKTNRMPPAEQFFIVNAVSPWLKVVRAVRLWMQSHPTPPLRISLAPEVLDAYWLGIDWRALRLSLYTCHLPDGRRWTVELHPMDIPDSVVFCSAKRV